MVPVIIGPIVCSSAVRASQYIAFALGAPNIGTIQMHIMVLSWDRHALVVDDFQNAFDSCFALDNLYPLRNTFRGQGISQLLDQVLGMKSASRPGTKGFLLLPILKGMGQELREEFPFLLNEWHFGVGIISSFVEEMGFIPEDNVNTFSAGKKNGINILININL